MGTTFSLRDYQENGKQGLKESFAKGNKRAIFCLPTGGGKTVTFVSMLMDCLRRGGRAMILCDRKELINQAMDKVTSMGLVPTVIAPGYKLIENNCYLASVDTLRRRQLPLINLLIVDEAHKQSFDKIIHKYIEFCDPFIIGATATPLRTGNQNCLSSIYTDIVEPITTGDLIDQKYLVPARTFASIEDFSDVKTRGGDYDVRALYDKMNKSSLYDGVVDNYNKFSSGKKAICFNVNVAHSIQMVQTFRDAGIEAVHIDGKTPKAQRTRILSDFKRGNFILSNCGVLTTGYDEPSIETVIINRATMSMPLYLQMCGRGSRIFDNKDNFSIIDQGANVYKHGLWQQDREWSLFKKRKRKGDGVAPVKCCEKCGAINHMSAKVCQECEEPFKIKEKKLRQAEFVEVKKDMVKKPNSKTATRQQLMDYAISKGLPKTWVFKELKRTGRFNSGF